MLYAVVVVEDDNINVRGERGEGRVVEGVNVVCKRGEYQVEKKIEGRRGNNSFAPKEGRPAGRKEGSGDE